MLTYRGCPVERTNARRPNRFDAFKYGRPGFPGRGEAEKVARTPKEQSKSGEFAR